MCDESPFIRDAFLVLLGALAYPVGARVSAVPRRVNNAFRIQRHALADHEIWLLRKKRDLLDEFIRIDNEFESRNLYDSGLRLDERENARSRAVDDLYSEWTKTLRGIQDEYSEFGLLENLLYKLKRKKAQVDEIPELAKIQEREREDLSRLGT